MNPFRLYLVSLVAFGLCSAGRVHAAEAASVSQYGITWTFDKPHEVGQFVTGDWWVVGPVTVTSVSPAPGPAPAGEPVTSGKSIYGATALHDDKTYRNGSMVVLGPGKGGGFTHQGYDSRGVDFDASDSIVYPYQMAVNQSLISTISSEAYDAKGRLVTPFIAASVFPGWGKRQTMNTALDSAAILTCLAQAPPADAFRPAYAGTDKTIYETKDIQWNLLPNLKPPASTPDWDKMVRVFQRPWLDHIGDWAIQFEAPGENQPAYGGDVTHASALAATMLLLDGPKEQKQKLMISYLQYGIDLHGLAEIGRSWFSDGGHWMGRKWPLLFTSLMLNKPEIREFPVVTPDFTKILYGAITLEPGSAGPPTTTIFSEDLDTYYGTGARGQKVLWRVTFHTHPRQPYQEKAFADWSDDDKFQNNYQWIPACWPGMDLAALYMKQKAVWNHDAFFDFCDWYMAPGQQRYDSKNGTLFPTRKGTDTFIQDMWDTYRASAPDQPGGTDNLTWTWDGAPTSDGKSYAAKKGHFIDNPKGP
jgi:hypothetical protein